MQINDVINGLYECFGSVFVLNHCRVLYKDKHVAGVSLLSVVFFLSWGFWNIYYYSSLGQTMSLYAGVMMTMANLLWVSMLSYYTWRNK